MNSVKAIKAFFEADGGRKVTMDELKELGQEARHELGALCCEALGVKWDPNSK